MATVTHQVERYEVVRQTGSKLPDGPVGTFVGLFAAGENWEARARPTPHLELLGTKGAAEAVDLVVRSTTLGWALRLRFEVIDKQLEMTQLEQRRLPVERGLLIGEDGEGAPVVIAEVADTVTRQPLTARLLRSVGFGAVADDAKRLLTDEAILNYLGPAWRTDQVRPGGVQRTPHYHAKWANRYVWALGKDGRRPNQVIVDADKAAGMLRTDDEVKQKLTRVRPEYLTRSPRPGLPGGELTQLSLSLLAEVGIEPGSDHVVEEPTSKEQSR